MKRVTGILRAVPWNLSTHRRCHQTYEYPITGSTIPYLA